MTFPEQDHVYCLYAGLFAQFTTILMRLISAPIPGIAVQFATIGYHVVAERGHSAAAKQ
jgi:hypothetical protein